MFGQQLNIHRIFKRLAKALIRLRVCAGWSEPLLVAHTTLLEISCHGSLLYFWDGPELFYEKKNTMSVIEVILISCLVGRHT